MYTSPLQSAPANPVFIEQKELPPAPPLPMDSPFVKSMHLLFPRENIEDLRKAAYHLQSNLTRALSQQIARDAKKNREIAQKMRDAIFGR